MSFFKKIKDKITGKFNQNEENFDEKIEEKVEFAFAEDTEIIEEIQKEIDEKEENSITVTENSQFENAEIEEFEIENEQKIEELNPQISDENFNLEDFNFVTNDDLSALSEISEDFAISENEEIENLIDASFQESEISEKSFETVIEKTEIEEKNITVTENIETVIEENQKESEKVEEKKSFFGKLSSFVEKTSEAVKSAFDVEKIKQGLEKTRKNFSDNLRKTLGVGRKIDENLLGEIEELLITADIGVDTTEQIIDSLRKRVKKENWENSEDLFKLLREEIESLMIESPSATNDKLYELDANKKPYVILVIGVNGVGKTTTIGKLAYNYKKNGKDVIIGAADTFRAAANEQLEIWAERAGVDIVQQQTGADPAAVAFDTVKSAQAKNKDVVIIDTAGRLHNKTHLMAELEKITRVMKKLKAEAPDEVFLILDATTGQNAIFQAKEFTKTATVTGIILTKLDGTAKGGVVIPIANELKIPVRYIGVGEQIDDLQVFDAKTFVDGLFAAD